MRGVTSFADVWIEITVRYKTIIDMIVTSFADVWIEIATRHMMFRDGRVTSFADVWIEMIYFFIPPS